MLNRISGSWRVQVYWPEGWVKRGDLHICLRTNLRLVWKPHNRGAGFQVLGFGAAFDWERR